MKPNQPAIAITISLLTTSVQAEGDQVNGRKIYETRCIGCHSIDSNRVGPAHRGVFGRRAGGVTGYDYSNAVASSDVIWTAQNLDQWLSSPEAFIPGQKMGYVVSDAKDRADLIAYLKSLGSTAHKP